MNMSFTEQEILKMVEEKLHKDFPQHTWSIIRIVPHMEGNYEDINLSHITVEVENIQHIKELAK